ncbi:hypothetical protein F52700_2486 [Fusarium sp. NRRL 52700]|nr:hypothetical protein F52700_2486 [Fusarium sp. NRRL 52700]
MGAPNWLRRRRFISEYLEGLGGDASVKWNEKLKVAYEVTMEGLEKEERVQVSHQWLEYRADRLAWDEFSMLPIMRHGFSIDQHLVSEQGSKSIEWPWNDDDLDPSDILFGVSPTYQKWRLQRSLPIYDTKAIGRKRAMVLSLDQRLAVWDSCLFEAPITGPYQIAIPAWVDLDNLVFGDNDHLLDMINNDIIPPHLAISWHNDDNSYITLVAGFHPASCISLDNEEAQDSLNYLWGVILIWVIGAYHGETMTLATFLRVRKAVPSWVSSSCCHSDLISCAKDSFNAVQRDILGYKEQARENQEFIAHCRPHVLEIIQKPIMEAKDELTSWVFQDDTALKRRIEVAHEIWVSSTTNERTIQEVCAWAWGLPRKGI